MTSSLATLSSAPNAQSDVYMACAEPVSTARSPLNERTTGREWLPADWNVIVLAILDPSFQMSAWEPPVPTFDVKSRFVTGQPLSVIASSHYAVAVTEPRIDNHTYFDITEGHLDIHNPLSPDGLALVTRYLGVQAGHRVLDVGCGSGHLLSEWAATWDVEAVGVDNNPLLLDRAKATSDRVTWVLADAAAHQVPAGSVDVGVCIGATYALGGYDGTVDYFGHALAPAGRVAIGEMYTDDAVTPITTAAAMEETRTLAELCARAKAAGLEPVGVVDSSTSDWDRYRSGAWQGFRAWAEANPADPRVPVVARRVRALRDEYLQRGRPHYRWAALVLARIT